jgi:hypothetical protein
MCMYVRMYVCMNVCMYLCMYVYSSFLLVRNPSSGARYAVGGMYVFVFMDVCMRSGDST